jgi:hypothetical protein
LAKEVTPRAWCLAVHAALATLTAALVTAALAGLLTRLLTRLLLAAALLLLTGLLPTAALLFAGTRIVLLLLAGFLLVRISHAGSSRIKRPS